MILRRSQAPVNSLAVPHLHLLHTPAASRCGGYRLWMMSTLHMTDETQPGRADKIWLTTPEPLSEAHAVCILFYLSRQPSHATSLEPGRSGTLFTTSTGTDHITQHCRHACPLWLGISWAPMPSKCSSKKIADEPWSSLLNDDWLLHYQLRLSRKKSKRRRMGRREKLR